MTDEDAENYEDYIIPPDQQLILDKLNMPLFTDQRANSNATSRLSHDSKEHADVQTAVQPIADDHSLTDTLLDDEFIDELGQELTKCHETQNLTHTLVDETQQDDTDDDDDDYIDASGGFELEVVQNTQNTQDTTVRRSTRNRVTVTETLPDESVSSPFSRKDASTSLQQDSFNSSAVPLSQTLDGNCVTESSVSKRRNLDAIWLTQPQTQDMPSQDMLSYPEEAYSHQGPVTQASQMLLASAASPSQSRDAERSKGLGEKVAGDELYDADMIGRKIIKTFGRHGTFEGIVQHYCG